MKMLALAMVVLTATGCNTLMNEEMAMALEGARDRLMKALDIQEWDERRAVAIVVGWEKSGRISREWADRYFSRILNVRDLEGMQNKLLPPATGGKTLFYRGGLIRISGRQERRSTAEENRGKLGL